MGKHDRCGRVRIMAEVNWHGSRRNAWFMVPLLAEKERSSDIDPLFTKGSGSLGTACSGSSELDNARR